MRLACINVGLFCINALLFNLLESLCVFDRILVKTDTGMIISLYVNASDTVTVGNVKLKIQATGHIPFDQQQLIFNEEVLENNDTTLAKYHIKNQSNLIVTGKPVDMMKIDVSFPTGKTISLSVYSTDTIADVKTKIEFIENLPGENQALIFNDTLLADSGTLFDYYIKANETLTLMYQSTGRMEIYIMDCFYHYTIPLIVKLSDTIGDIKTRLKSEKGISCDMQELIFDEWVLDDNDILADRGINRESTLTLIRLSTGFMCISVETPTGMRFALDVKPSNTIRNVKSKIQDKLGIPLSYQRLVFNGKHLEDNITIADYHIYKDEMLHLKFDD
ncbi:putative Ubiquitin-like domain-containing protein [Helianthus annuus]|nr:putative Ubiquitin-like domain-containing protein [Helianthus annuus]